MFAIKFSIEKRINFFWTAGFFLPAINATVFSTFWIGFCQLNFYQNVSNFFFEVLQKLPLDGAKDGHFSFFQRSCKIGLSKIFDLSKKFALPDTLL
jgi:hypothetical protein